MSSRRIRLAPPAETRRPAGAAAGAITRIATFLLLLAAGLVALLFAVRLVAAALDKGFSPFSYFTPNGHALLAWLLAIGMVVLAGLIWLVLRHDTDALWLASPVGGGGVLVPNEDLERPAASAAGRAHLDVVRVEVEFSRSRSALRGRVKVRARPLADAGAVGDAVDAAVRRQVTRLTGRELERLTVRVRVLRVTQLARYLP